MPYCPLIREDLMIIATGQCLVAEEMNRLVFDSSNVLLSLDMLKTVCLVPSGWEHVEGDLPANGEPGWTLDAESLSGQ